MEEARLPLEGRKILTVDEKLPLTYCSMLLGDLGAEVTCYKFKPVMH